MSAYGRHSELSRKVPPLLTPFSHKKDPNLDSERTTSCSDTPSIRSYLLKLGMEFGKSTRTSGEYDKIRYNFGDKKTAEYEAVTMRR